MFNRSVDSDKIISPHKMVRVRYIILTVATLRAISLGLRVLTHLMSQSCLTANACISRTVGNRAMKIDHRYSVSAACGGYVLLSKECSVRIGIHFFNQ